MKVLFKEIGKMWYIYLFATICLIIAVTIDMYSPRIAKQIVDEVIVGGVKDRFVFYLCGIGAIGIGRMIFQYFKEFSFDYASSKVASGLREDLYKHIQSLSVGYFDKTNTGELMARAKEDVDNIWGATGMLGMLIIEIVLHISLVITNMMKLCPKLAIAPLVMMPVVAFLSIYMEKKLDKIYGDISEQNATLNTTAEENLSGVRTVKAFAREKYEITKFIGHNRRYKELSIKSSKTFAKYYPYIVTMTSVLTCVTVLIGGMLVINDEITIGTLIAFVAYCGYVVWPMEMLGWMSNDTASAIASIKKLKKIYAEKPEIADPAEPVELEKVTGHVSFENVDFSIGDKQILKDVSFDIPAGHTLGIMGATGSGKTTIVNLLCRFYDPQSGRVCLEGEDVRNLRLNTVRTALAPVTQEVFLFSDTISENVKFGKKAEITDEKVLESLQAAECMEFVGNYEEGVNTLIGERGVGLSGGQKQRISMARAFAKDAPVLILDDSTSALDMETEKKIQKELKKRDNVTKIIIAHRISAVRYADEIIFLKDGEIAERGTHEELLEKKGLYYETYMSQYSE